jgi:Capsule assembly protein Wzi
MPLHPRTPLLAVALLAAAAPLQAQTAPRPDSVPPAAAALPADPPAATTDTVTGPAVVDGADTVAETLPGPATVEGTEATAGASVLPPPDPDGAAGQAGGSLLLPLWTVGGAHEEGGLMAQLRGEASAAGALLRSPSSSTPRAARDGFRLLAPEVVTAYNSRIPFSVNDGALWAGAGAGTLAMAGFAAQAGPVRLIVAPELAYSANAAFDTLVPLAWRQADAVTWYPDWQTNEHAIDLPYRMGDEPEWRVLPGQSSLTVDAGPLAFGAATENQWWGPGVRNALVLSNQAAGFAHLFARTARPLATPVGTVDARWISGALRDSEWYARARGGERGWRSFSAAAVVIAPTPGVTLGMARSVYAPADGAGDALAGGADVFTRWSGSADSTAAHPFEQITAFWLRLAMPAEGAEAYLEWARTRLPGLRGVLEEPEHSQGYTLGLQWLRPAGAGDVRLQVEHTYLEESPTWAWRNNGSWYASAAVPQGYTHEGQLLGASVGPGASGQWLAVDWLRGRGRAGAFMGRYRWAEDARYDKPGGPEKYLDHDASLFGGVRAALVAGGVRVDAEYALERRWNYLFQSDATNFLNRNQAVHVWNHALRLRFTAGAPRLGRAR